MDVRTFDFEYLVEDTQVIRAFDCKPLRSKTVGRSSGLGAKSRIADTTSPKGSYYELEGGIQHPENARIERTPLAYLLRSGVQHLPSGNLCDQHLPPTLVSARVAGPGCREFLL
jgi:hypothetical protein